jgi:hypothetical protein
MQFNMSEQYVHTLIPNEAQFVPKPEQVIRFLDGLSALGAAPLNPKLTVMRPSGRVRSFMNPLTGETKSIPANDRVNLESTTDLAPIIEALPQYSVVLDGQGPPRLSPFPLYSNDALFTQKYGFIVCCRLRAEPVSMSDPGEERTGSEVPFFGKPCATDDATGLFHHPVTGNLIKVANAGCARFWLELEFGKWLLPKIDDSLAILNPAIVTLAGESFALEFAQGLHLL